MLTQTAKAMQWKQFMETYFGMENWIEIFLLKVNISYQVRTINFLLKTVRESEKNAILDNLSDVELLRMKHHLILDIIMKTQISIEALLVAIDVLSQAPDKIAEKMTYYAPQYPREIVNKIRKKEIDLRKALMLPAASSVEVLNKEERDLIEKLSQETVDTTYGALQQLADFYDRYYITYMKCKHGLTIETGSGINSATSVPELQNSLIYVRDRRKKREDVPKDHKHSYMTGFSASNWFNTVSIITVNENLEKDIEGTTHNLVKLTNYLIDNHLEYIANCGENFLPYEIRSTNSVSLQYFGNRDLTQDELAMMIEIQDKLVTVMHTPKLELRLNRNIFDPAIQELLVRGPVTTLWTGD